MIRCTTSGCPGVAEAVFSGLDGWKQICPVCGAEEAIAEPRRPDEADLLAAQGCASCHGVDLPDYPAAEQHFRRAAETAGKGQRRLFYLWWSLLCRYGVSFVKEILYPMDPARRTNLFTPTFGRFPLPDYRVMESDNAKQFVSEQLHTPLPTLMTCLSELDTQVRDIGKHLQNPENLAPVFIAWHDRQEDKGGPCYTFADKLSDRLHLKHIANFVSFKSLEQRGVAVTRYEPYIYAALASAKVMVIVIDDYTALGQKFLASEVRRFMIRQKQDDRLQIYFCGLKDHIGMVPAFMNSLQRHHEDCTNEYAWYELIATRIKAKNPTVLLDEVQSPAQDVQAQSMAAHTAQPEAATMATQGVQQPAHSEPQPDKAPEPAVEAQSSAGTASGQSHSSDILAARAVENGQWTEAARLLEPLLAQDPDNPEWLLLQLLTNCRLRNSAGLAACTLAYEEQPQWEALMQNARAARKAELKGYLAASQALRRQQAEAAAKAEQEAQRRKEEQLREASRQDQRQQARAMRELKRKGIVAKLEDGVLTILEASRLKEQQLALPSGVSVIADRAFAECRSLNRMIVPEGVREIGKRAFAGCTALTAVELPASLSRLGEEAFMGCAALTSVNLPQRLNSIDSRTFSGCQSLAAICLPNRLNRVDQQAFAGCTSLTSIDFPASLRILGSCAFYGTALQQVTLPVTLTRLGSNPFGGCQKLEQIHVPEEHPTLYVENGVLMSRQDERMICYPASRQESVYRVPDGTRIVDGAFAGCARLTEVVFPDGLREIGDYTFFDCRSLTELYVPAGMTAIGSHAFADCDQLTHITLPDSVATLGDSAFAGCLRLESIRMPQRMTAIGAMAFSLCPMLSRIAIPRGVTAIEAQTFMDCTGLREVSLPASLNLIGPGAFSRCKSLPAITLPEGVTTLSDMAFGGCQALTSITLPRSLTNISSTMLAGCTHLEELVVERGSAALRFCKRNKLPWRIAGKKGPIRNAGRKSSLQAAPADGPATDSSKAAEPIAGGAAKNAAVGPALQTAGEPARKGGKAKVILIVLLVLALIGGALYLIYAPKTNIYARNIPFTYTRYHNGTVEITDYRGSDAEVTVPAMLDGYPVTAITEGAFRYTRVESVVISEGITTIGENAFASCNGLTSVTLPESLTTIGEYAFYNCEELRRITLPVNLTTIGGSAFRYSGLEWIIIPASVTSIGDYAFSATPLQEVVISDGRVTLGTCAFNNCSKLTAVELTGVAVLGGSAFQNCDQLKQITLPATLSVIAESAFQGCEKLSNVTFAPGRPGVTTIAESAFEDCAALASITLPDTLTTLGPSAFEDCAGLTAITIPGTVQEIGKRAFYNCDMLESAILGEGVTTIHEQAFYDCAALAHITLPATLKTVRENAFYYRSIQQIAVPEGSYAETYCRMNNFPYVVGE